MLVNGIDNFGPNCEVLLVINHTSCYGYANFFRHSPNTKKELVQNIKLRKKIASNFYGSYIILAGYHCGHVCFAQKKYNFSLLMLSLTSIVLYRFVKQ